jgi:4-hydroxy-2-oxoheptanedioate aldolase
MNPLRRIWAEERTAFGIWAAIPSGFSAEVVARTGPDYVCVDQQHGLTGDDALPELLRAIAAGGAMPIARVPANYPYLIGRALDLGALGVVVPLIEDAEAAARAVAACRYPPAGTRSYGPIRAADALGSTDPDALGSEVLCFVMVETRRGLDNVDAIAATPGLDGIYIGPSDLAIGLGLKPGPDESSEEHAQAVEAILAACLRHGVVPGIQCRVGEAAAARAAQGFRLVTKCLDFGVMRTGVARELALARGGTPA